VNCPRPVPPLSTTRLRLPDGTVLPTQLDLARELHKRGRPGLSLAEFAVAAWEGRCPDGKSNPLEAVPLAWNWHIQSLCDHVEALLLNLPGPQGQACPQNLLINVPPGSMKSLIFSVFTPAWMWLFRPQWRAIYASGTPSVVTRDSVKCRNLIKSEWYQQTFKPSWTISPDQDEKQHFANSAGGFRKGTAAGAAVTGERADFLGVDDPNDAKEITSKAHRTTINENWWDAAFHNRIADPTLSKRGVIMQRLHEEDLAGHVLEKEKGEWAHLSIPMEYEASGAGDRPTWLGWVDPRKEEQLGCDDKHCERTGRDGPCPSAGMHGELMFPARFTLKYLAGERKTLGSAGYAGQMQQRPVSAEGNRFQRSWWRFWSPTGQMGTRPKGAGAVPPIRYMPGVDRRDLRMGSWDCTFKDTDGSDYVVGGTIDIVGSRRIVVERYRKKASFPETERAMQQQYEDLQPDEIVVEDKANGSAVISSLAAKVPGLIPVNPQGGKEARAAILEPKVEAGNWYLPEDAPWLDEWIDEFAAFPKGRHDDQVDMASQAEVRLLEDPDVVATRALLGLS
jgi:predicted phage terminase large subunit-like protein